MRCLAITLNAAIDTTYTLARLAPGETQRVGEATSAPGGKGNNVARVLAAQGHAVVASGFVAGRAGAFIERGLRRAGIATAFTRVPGESRTCLTIVESATGRVSELLEPGVAIGPAAARRFLRHASALAREADAVVVSGSLPAGLPPDYYADLLRALRAGSAVVALDTSGEALRLGLAGGPDLIKPNEAELAALVGPTGGIDALVARVRERLLGSALGPGARVVASLGARGAALIAADRAIVAAPPPIRAVNPVGAGDALLAGFLAALVAGEGDNAALAWGVACGAAAALKPVAGELDPAEAARLRAGVRLTTLAPRPAPVATG